MGKNNVKDNADQAYMCVYIHVREYIIMYNYQDVNFT